MICNYIDKNLLTFASFFIIRVYLLSLCLVTFQNAQLINHISTWPPQSISLEHCQLFKQYLQSLISLLTKIRRKKLCKTVVKSIFRTIVFKSVDRRFVLFFLPFWLCSCLHIVYYLFAIVNHFWWLMLFIHVKSLLVSFFFSFFFNPSCCCYHLKEIVSD